MGRIPPALFIRLAEDTGFISEIGLWVCGTSCRQAKAWAGCGLTDVVMSFNVSVHQLDDTELPRKIGDMIKSAGVEPSMMKVEVTESAGLSSDNAQNLLLGELRDMGLKIAIDDFGMGHTSLVYLKQFPVSMIKLDGSIVKDITTDAASAEIVSSISELCRGMNIDLIAEFVETEEQARRLKSLGCHLYQGYLYSPPVLPEKFTALYEKGFDRV
jgi:EAL domain-containing protein (putative c-di-GMP-specific phosphodiesterase class I)